MFAFVIAALLSTAQIELGGKIATVEIADSPETRSKGLMGRTLLPEDSGMLFVFEESEILSFWMKDTLIPLSIGFFDEEQRLIHTLEMDPPTSPFCPSYKSKAAARYALEMPQKWFSKNKIQPDMKFSFHDPSPSVK